MSLNKSAIRLSLLAGSSLAAMLTSQPAFAANECGDPSANGATADLLTCASPPTYATGVDYSTTTNGNLTLILQNRFDTGTAGTGGIRMFGKTGESMTLLRDDTPAGAGDPRIINTAGRAIDVTTLGAGNVAINLTDGDPTSETSTNVTTGTAPIRITGSTDAIRAEAIGTGAVTVTFTQTGTASGVSHPLAVVTAGATVGSNGSGLVARTTTGAINLDTRGASFSVNGTNGGAAIEAVSTSGNIIVTAGSLSGRLRGVLAQTGGAGTINLTLTGASANGTTGLAGIDTVAGTGTTLITVTGGVSGGAGAAIRAVSANTSATAAVNVQNTGGTLTGRVDFSGVSAGGVTFNTNSVSNAARWSASGTSTFSGFGDTVTVGGGGAFTTAANTVVNFGAGNDTFTVSAALPNVLAAGTVIDFGTGTDTLTLSSRSRMAGAVLSFGDGVDTLNLGGVMVMDGLTVNGLETLSLSGTILMGGGTGGTVDYVNTDAAADDVMVMTGGTFTGAGGRVVVDVLLDMTQEGCAVLTGAADCLDLRGASSAGETLLTLNYIGESSTPGGFGRGITLVDLAGAGTSAQGHFVVDPGTTGYLVDPVFGGVMDRPGLFTYGVRYDAANQRQVLTGLPRSQVMEYAVLSGAAQSIWHMTARTVTGRQTELREGPEAAPVWVRTTGEYTRRDVSTAFDSFGQAIAFDNGYKLYAGTVMGGLDLASGTSGDYEYVTGLQIGYVSSSFDFNRSDTSGRFSGATGGAYASVWSDWFFLDGTVNLNGLTLDYNAPGLHSKTTTFLNSIGAALETGTRTRFTENTFVEPLATLSWVRTTFEEISLSGGEVQPADAESLRGSLGMRFGSTLAGESFSASYFLTGRGWYEFEGESATLVHNPGVDLPLADEFTGAFGETELGMNVFNAANTISGFAVAGVKFKDGYSALNLSLGVRMAW